MAKRSSSSMEALLGLLTIEPMSGYDLGQTVRMSIGHFWNESYGQIYPNLKKLAAGGFVSGKTEKQKGKPDRQIYSITKKGRERLAAWLKVEPQPEIPRNELLLKLFFAVQAEPENTVGFVERMAHSEGATLARLNGLEKEIAKLRRYPDAPYWKMALRFGQLELEAHQRWAEETLAELRKLNGRQRDSPAARKEQRHGSK
jgi:PadR family transcriptional regulator, regulatory protein AphA